MLPVKDNLAIDRLPLVTIALAVAGVVAHLVLPHDGGWLRLLAGVAFLAWFGPSVEDSMARPRFLALCLLGGVLALAVQLALDADGELFASASAGVVAAVVGAYAALYLRARVVSVVLVPLLFSLVELPAWVLLALWPAAQAAFGDWAAFAAQAAGLFAGAAASRALVQRHKPVPPALSKLHPEVAA